MGMESKEYRKQLKQLIDHHGADETLTICTEECAELIKEITKYKRAKNHTEQIGCRGRRNDGCPDLYRHDAADF